jgi:hypothetical protein
MGSLYGAVGEVFAHFHKYFLVCAHLSNFPGKESASFYFAGAVAALMNISINLISTEKNSEMSVRHIREDKIPFPLVPFNGLESE